MSQQRPLARPETEKTKTINTLGIDQGNFRDEHKLNFIIETSPVPHHQFPEEA